MAALALRRPAGKQTLAIVLLNGLLLLYAAA
jgi:hypothetical protein